MININFQYAYLILDIPFVIVWILIFVLSKNTRKEQIWMSFLLLITATLGEILYFKDYWNPASIFSMHIWSIRILIEDLIFSFAIAGIGAVIYEAIFRIKLSKIDKKFSSGNNLIIILCIGIIISLSLFFLGINSIFSTSAGFVAIVLFYVSKRKDLLFNSLLSGFAIMIIMFISYFLLFNIVANSEELLQKGWLLYGTSLGIRIFGIPLTEMIWGFTVGMFLGPLYEFLTKRAIK